MMRGAPTVTADSHETNQADAPSTRADATRQLLLAAARRRFAIDGYASTTVREIATDAGVNVALINRYFESKEGLFEACLVNAAENVDRDSGLSLEGAVAAVVERVAAGRGNDDTLHMLLLLRTSGDERADAIRRRTLRTFSEKIAALAGWKPGQDDGDELLLRAEIAIAMSLGIALLRTSSDLEPLTSATEHDLTSAVGDAFSALLVRPRA